VRASGVLTLCRDPNCLVFAIFSSMLMCIGLTAFHMIPCDNLTKLPERLQMGIYGKYTYFFKRRIGQAFQCYPGNDRELKKYNRKCANIINEVGSTAQKLSIASEQNVKLRQTRYRALPGKWQQRQPGSTKNF